MLFARLVENGGHACRLRGDNLYPAPSSLPMRMSMRRFTRLTKAFSKRIENHAISVARLYRRSRSTTGEACALQETGGFKRSGQQVDQFATIYTITRHRAWNNPIELS